MCIVRQIEIVPVLGRAMSSNLSTNEWVTQQFDYFYLTWDYPIEEPFGGLDHMLLLAWVRRQFSESQPFVLHYWDLRLPNIMIDENEDLAA